MRNKEEEHVREIPHLQGLIFEFDYYCLHKRAQFSKEVVPSSLLCDKTKKRIRWMKILRYIHTAWII